jgi:hypothetical protein
MYTPREAGDTVLEERREALCCCNNKRYPGVSGHPG